MNSGGPNWGWGSPSGGGGLQMASGIPPESGWGSPSGLRDPQIGLRDPKRSGCGGAPMHPMEPRMGTLPTPPNCTQGPPQSLPSPSTSAPLLPPIPPTSAHTTPLPAPPPTHLGSRAGRSRARGGRWCRGTAAVPSTRRPPSAPTRRSAAGTARKGAGGSTAAPARGGEGGAVRRPQTQFGITDPIGDPRPN